LREKVQTELSLRAQLEDAEQRLSEYDQLSDERDAWKASTRQLETCVFDLSRKNRILEEALNSLEEEYRRTKQNGQQKKRHPHPADHSDFESAPPEGDEHGSEKGSASQEEDEDGEDEEPGSLRGRQLNGKGQSPLTSRSSSPSHRSRGHPQNLDFSKFGCRKCHKELVLIV